MKNNLTALDVLAIKTKALSDRPILPCHTEEQIAAMTENLVNEVVGRLAERAANCELLETFVYFTPAVSGTCFVMYPNRTWRDGTIQLSVDTRQEIHFANFGEALSLRGFDFDFGYSSYWANEDTEAVCPTLRVFVRKTGLCH
jgi:hypothetical protein